MAKRKQLPRITPDQLEALEQALHVGCIMSNVCWAIGQGQSLHITDANRDSYRDLQRKWDHYAAVLHRMKKDAQAIQGPTP